MPIDVSKLSRLFDNQEFRSWMENNAPDVIREVDEAKKENASDLLVQSRIVSNYNKIYSDPNLRSKFKEFVLSRFPEAVTPESDAPLPAQLMLPPRVDPNGVFSYYHPNILRFPMQMMLQSSDPHQLVAAIKEFVGRFKSRYETAIVGKFGYIEYIPNNLARYNIPDDNWEIPIYQSKINKR